MKTVNQFIEESKIKNLFIPELDVKAYLDKMLSFWLENVKNAANITYMDKRQKIVLCRQCEVLLYILDKFIGDIPLHFIAADKEAKDKFFYSYDNSNSILTAFNVIMKIMEVEVPEQNCGFEEGDDLEGEIKELKDRFEDLVKKSNEAWNKKYNKDGEAGVPKDAVECPCCCDCCKAC